MVHRQFIAAGYAGTMNAAAWLIPLFLLAPGLAHADGDRDHDRARRAVLAGRILPLEQVLERARPHLRGELLEAELEDEDGRPIYEFKLITPGGRVVKMRFDAGDGRLLERGGR